MAKLTRQLNTVTEAGLTGSNREAKSWVFADACDVREAAAGGGTVETAGYACLLMVEVVSSRLRPAVWRATAITYSTRRPIG